jgi:hypothetical protein
MKLKQQGLTEGVFIILTGLLAVTLVCVTIYLVIKRENEWEVFKASHACAKTAVIQAEVFNTLAVGPNGQVQVGVGTTPMKTGWTCNDGITYYR